MIGHSLGAYGIQTKEVYATLCLQAYTGNTTAAASDDNLVPVGTIQYACHISCYYTGVSHTNSVKNIGNVVKIGILVRTNGAPLLAQHRASGDHLVRLQPHFLLLCGGFSCK